MATFPIFSPPPERRDSAASTTSTSPAKRVKDMTPEERLASLKEWAEEQKYIQPGRDGTFGYGGLGAYRPVTYSGPVRYVEPTYTGYIAPPSYESVQASSAQKKHGLLKRWLKKRKAEKAKKRHPSEVCQ